MGNFIWLLTTLKILSEPDPQHNSYCALLLTKVRPVTEDKKRIQELVKTVDKLTLDNTEINKQKETAIAQLSAAKDSSATLDLNHQESLSKIEDLRKEVATVTQENDDLKISKIELQSIIEKYKNNASAVPIGAIVIELTEGETKVVDMVCAAESERLKKEITPDILLKNVFFFIVVKGPHDVFSAPISLQKIRQLSEPSKQTE